MELEERSVRWGRTTIDFGVRRSPKRKTVSIAVDPADGVLLTAPSDASDERLDQVVWDKAPWIARHLLLIAEQDVRPKPRRFVGGESYAYLGRHYRLRVQPRAVPGQPKLDHGFLVVQVGRKLRGEDRARAVESRLRDWYLARACHKLPERLARWAPRVGVPLPELLIRKQQKRWGSCDPTGTLRLNWKILQAPIRLVDYVVAHELVHLVHKDHSNAFWTRLGQAMPDYDRRKDELRRMGPRLEW